MVAKDVLAAIQIAGCVLGADDLIIGALRSQGYDITADILETRIKHYRAVRAYVNKEGIVPDDSHDPYPEEAA